jgi:DNA-binding transcriptional regulator YhcF (GntR family)
MKRSVDLGEADPRLYVRLAARLRRQILDGEVVPGQRIPSITALSQELGCARQTCGRAVRLLEQEGLLRFIPGLGYYATAAAETPLRPGCQTGDHDIVDVRAGKAVGAGVVLEGGDHPLLGLDR